MPPSQHVAEISSSETGKPCSERVQTSSIAAAVALLILVTPVALQSSSKNCSRFAGVSLAIIARTFGTSNQDVLAVPALAWRASQCHKLELTLAPAFLVRR